MDRIDMVQEYMDKVFSDLQDDTDKKIGYVHVYGVAQACALLAMKRGMDAELATIAGMLHDVYTYKTLDVYDHAHKGASLARGILEDMQVFSQDEIKKISQAIYRHSDKGVIGDPFDELLKDADVLQHCLYNPFASVAPKEEKRYQQLKLELGISNES